MYFNVWVDFCLIIIYFSRFCQISLGLEIIFQHLHHSITPIRIKRDLQMSKDRFRSTRATIIPMRMAVFQKSIRNKCLQSFLIATRICSQTNPNPFWGQLFALGPRLDRKLTWDQHILDQLATMSTQTTLCQFYRNQLVNRSHKS